MITTTHTVTGMSCDHCVRAVSDAVGGLDGVADVRVDLDSGSVTVDSEAELDVAAFTAAVEEAGYEVAA